MRSLLLCASLSVVSISNAQAPAIEWKKCLGGTLNDLTIDVETTSDGGIVAAIDARSSDGDVTGYHGLGDIWVVKLNNAGTIEWQRALGGSGNEGAMDIAEASDGGILVAGYTFSNDGDVSGFHGGDGDLWVVKLTATGALLWQRPCGTAIPGDGFPPINTYPPMWWPRVLVPTTDGGCFLGATARSTDGDVVGHHGEEDLWIVKLGPAGALEWQKPLGGSDRDELAGVEGTADGGVIALGWTQSNDGDVTGNHGSDMWLVKLSATGTLEWQRAMGGSTGAYAYDVRQTDDGGYIAQGHSVSTDGDLTGLPPYGLWLIKLDAAGGIEWQNRIGNFGEYYFTVQQTIDGGYITAGTTRSSDGGDVSGYHGPDPTNGDYWVVKLSTTGSIEWQLCLGGDEAEELRAFEVTNDGGCIVHGNSYGSSNGDVTGNHGILDSWVAKVSGTGSLQWQMSLGSTESELANVVHTTPDGGYIVATDVPSGNGNVTGSGYHDGWDTWLVKFASDGTGIDEASMIDFTISPVPATSTLQVSSATVGRIHLHDALGREVLSRAMNGTTHTLDVSDLPRGVYTITLRTANGSKAQRFVLE